MNIKISNLNESINKSPLSEGDLFAFIDSEFPDNATNWKQATMEIVDMANWIQEVVFEINGEKAAEPLKDTSKSKTPKEWNTKHKARIKTGFPLLNKHYQKVFFDNFGHWIDGWKLRTENLNESQQIVLDEENEIEDVLRFKKNQFTFDSGLFLGTIPSKLNTKFGLFWHVMETTDIESFVQSVINFMLISDDKFTLSDLDNERLRNHYNKYFTE